MTFPRSSRRATSTIALATVGILIGVQNLGYLFTNGFQRRIVPEILAGVVAVVVIALLVAFALVATLYLRAEQAPLIGRLALAAAAYGAEVKANGIRPSALPCTSITGSPGGGGALRVWAIPAWTRCAAAS